MGWTADVVTDSVLAAISSLLVSGWPGDQLLRNLSPVSVRNNTELCID
jgi:hypothetical protein